MKPFLQQLADELFLTYGKNISNLCLVFPNRRAGLYFRKYLANHLDNPLWSPEICTIEDFVARKSGFTIAGQPALLINLYKLYHFHLGEKARPLKDFITWGNQLLSDFDEIDQYLADGTSVFSYLTEARVIEHWNPDGKALTDFEKNYLHFYNALAPLYAQFRAELITQRQAYLGLASRWLAENIDTISFGEWEMVVFAGFNALTPVEEKIFSTLLASGKAKIYWDTDHYYLDDTNQEAGLFIRKYLESNQFGPINWIFENYKNENRSIHVAGIPKNIGQVKFAGQLLEQLNKQDEGTIAVVLVDESQLIPVLNSIPSGISDFNVTMGFPLKLTPAFSLSEAVFSLLLNSQKNSRRKEHKPNARFYREDILRLLRHPYVVNLRMYNDFLASDDAGLKNTFYSSHELLTILREVNKQLAEIFGSYIEHSDSGDQDVLLLLQQLTGLVKDVIGDSNAGNGQISSKPSSVEMEFLFATATIVHDLRALIAELPESPDLETICALYAGLASTMRIPFHGEPLKGIQVMGVLETRTLDFDTLIMISVNEGLLPKGKRHNSFIPADIRTEFGLPGYREQNAVFAYHFYRLLQRAKTAWLLYNTEADELGNGERSRFITQLLYELPDYSQHAGIEEELIGSASVINSQQVITIPKNSDTLSRLKEIALSGFSPSLLSSYLTCSLQFYYSAILGLREADTVEETIDASMLGNAVHSVLYQVYKPFMGREIDAGMVRSCIDNAIGMVRDEFGRLFPGSDLDTGKNHIIVYVARNMVRGFLETEADRMSRDKSKLRVLYLEEKFFGEKEIIAGENHETTRVVIKGTTDRIDLLGEQLRIIDYKTGSVQPPELSLEDPGDLMKMKKPQKMLQLLCYAWLYRQKYKSDSGFVAGIVSLKTPKKYLQKVKVEKTELLNDSVLIRFDEYLSKLLEEIFNMSIPFQQTENQDNCSFCSFRTICRR